jgi:hypothetical protein
MKLVKYILLPSVLVVALIGCSKNAALTPNDDVVSVGKKCPTYSITELVGFPRFKAKILDKSIIDTPGSLMGNPQITNHSALLLLQKEDGTEFFASDKHASENVLRIVNSLERSNSYFFPDALTNRN